MNNFGLFLYDLNQYEMGMCMSTDTLVMLCYVFFILIWLETTLYIEI